MERSSDKFSQLGRQAVVAIMATAAVTGMLELPNHQDSNITLVNQPVLAFAGDNLAADNPLRREKESNEAGVVQISYSVAQRTPARSSGIK